ncbi:MAG: metallopeptidase TldD-related protein [Myxococcales bacterium]|jgi:PmbA protein|nr:TldD/PmbA family protein [Myxococcales bacterium]HIK86533.1 TldD/PmbA family protein [Myxococcales bacterium]
MSQTIDATTMETVVTHALESAKLAGASQCDVLLVEGNDREVRVRGDEVEFVKQAQERGLGIRTLVAGKDGLQTAVVSTSDLAPDAVERMAQEAVALARATAPDPFAGIPEDGFATELPDLGLFDESDFGVSLDARIEDAKRAEAAARATDKRIDNSQGSQASSGFARIVYGNHHGFLSSYQSASHGLFSEPLARDGDSMQRDYWMTAGRRLSDLDDPAIVGRKAANRALRRLGAKRVATCVVPVLFDGLTAPSLIGQLTSCLSGYSIYRESSFLADKMGEMIASSNVTIIDDGRLQGGLGSKPFDGEGQQTRRNVLLEDGQLKSWLLDHYSAKKLGLTSTGSASRGTGSAPHVGTTNLWLEPGEKTLDELIAEIDRGLLVTELIGMGFNPTTGDYSRGAAGLWIENGEIVHPVEEITIAGNLGEMLKQIDRVGSELVWRGRTASPPVRISQMTIAGE